MRNRYETPVSMFSDTRYKQTSVDNLEMRRLLIGSPETRAFIEFTFSCSLTLVGACDLRTVHRSILDLFGHGCSCWDNHAGIYKSRECLPRLWIIILTHIWCQLGLDPYRPDTKEDIFSSTIHIPHPTVYKSAISYSYKKLHPLSSDSSFTYS